MFVRRLVTIAALLIAPCCAMASQTLTCEIKDGDLQFDLQAALGSLANSRLNGVSGRLEWKARDARPATAIDIAPEFLAQEWIVDSDLRLRFHQESEGEKPEVDLIVTTKQAGESQFRGQYRLSSKAKGKEWKSSGRVRCELGY